MISQKNQRIVMERQGGRCAMGAECLMATEDERGVDLEDLKRSKMMDKYLPDGFTAYQKDHIIPLAQGGLDVLENIQMLCGFCHHEKTKIERDDWEAPSPSVFNDLVKSRGSKGIGGPSATRKGGGKTAKAMSLRTNFPRLKYGAAGR